MRVREREREVIKEITMYIVLEFNSYSYNIFKNYFTSDWHRG